MIPFLNPVISPNKELRCTLRQRNYPRAGCHETNSSRVVRFCLKEAENCVIMSQEGYQAPAVISAADARSVPHAADSDADETRVITFDVALRKC